MEESNSTNEEIAPEIAIGSGAILSNERKRVEKTVEEIADELNLSVSQIRSIERDQSEGLPEPTYVRGYIRSYAKLLGLDAEEVLNHYQNKNWQKSTNLDDIPRGISESDEAESSFMSPLRLLAILTFIGLSGYGYYLYQSKTVEQVSSSGVIQIPTDVRDENIEQLSDASTQDEGSTSASQLPEALEQSIQLESEPQQEVPSTLADSNLIAAENVIVMKFLETSWVDIRDEAQEKLAYQSYPAGDQLEISSGSTLSILLGNAKGVEMTLNGLSYDLAQHTQGVYAKFQIDGVSGQ